MRELVRSFVRFSSAMTLFGLKQAKNLLRPPAHDGLANVPAALDSIARTAEEQMGEGFGNAFRALDRWQNEMVDSAFGLLGRTPSTSRAKATRTSTPAQAALPIMPPPSRPSAQPATESVCRSGRLDATRFVVLGEGLASGVGDFALSTEFQSQSFPAQMARQMGATFSQPLIQLPGLGDLVGFARLPVLVPALTQTTVLESFPTTTPYANLSFPGLRLADAVTARPIAPLVHRDDSRQTLMNLIVGMPGLLYGDRSLPTPLEAACSQKPTFVIVALGYHDVLAPAVSGDLAALPKPEDFKRAFARLLRELRGTGADVLVLTVPDPLDTAHFAPPAEAARSLRVRPEVLRQGFGIPDDGLVTLNGLLDIAHQLLGGQKASKPGRAWLAAEQASRIRDLVQNLNASLIPLANSEGAAVYDLHALFRQVRNQGIQVGRKRLTGAYLGGFYSLNGYYPGMTGQAVIARELLGALRKTYGCTWPDVDVAAILKLDPVADYRPAGGTELSWDDYQARIGQARQRLPVPVTPSRPAGPARAVPADSHRRPDRGTRSDGPLRLPEGREQVLPLNPYKSFHGDGLRAVNCADDQDAAYGRCANLLFGGLALFAGRLHGALRFTFSSPVKNVTHFEISWGDSLTGDDGVLSAPRLFRLPVLEPHVLPWPGSLPSGDLNLETGEVTNLDFKVQFINSAVATLVNANPNFPKAPIQFPGAYGSAWARFTQRPDGNLDFSFQGTTFLPLGKDFGGQPIRWALPLGAFTGSPASVPARGTALHPHLHLSTEETSAAPDDAEAPRLPSNTIQEFALFGHNSSFGDHFSLRSVALGGDTVGRSHLLGRIQIQFGEPFGTSVPFAISSLPPGGLLVQPPDLPIAALFPGRLSFGLRGHNEFLRFPLRTYALDSVAFIDDPFDIALGAADMQTGLVHGELLYRGFIAQSLLFALMRIEPRTPHSSFFFQGPASFERGVDSQLVFRFNAAAHVPYPAGYLFPAPDLAASYVMGPGSALDPYFRLQAMVPGATPPRECRGGARMTRASNGDLFSYKYRLPGARGGGCAEFEYTNHSQGATFCLRSLSWQTYFHSRSNRAGDVQADAFAMAGFGTWTSDPTRGLHAVAVHVSVAPDSPYVSIQVDGGLVSNVNTRPELEAQTLP